MAKIWKETGVALFLQLPWGIEQNREKFINGSFCPWPDSNLVPLEYVYSVVATQVCSVHR
jgi:hypothetical protein